MRKKAEKELILTVSNGIIIINKTKGVLK